MIRFHIRLGCRLALLACLAASSAAAQERPQSPAAFLGYELGSRFTPHHRVVDYVAHVAAHSANVSVQPYGETYEGRPLLVAFVSAPGNLRRLEELRTSHLQAAGLTGGTAGGARVALVWLSYSVHGNESVSTEAAMATLYDLANPDNARTQPWLENTVVVIDPCINPDGRERYVQWYNRTVGRTPNPEPAAREHHEPWPGGRTNHYYFDLNRDWAWMTQQETQQRLALYNTWMPHVHVDFHEQGVDEPYYFAPAAEPFHESITPWQRSFQATIGQNNARYFDAAGWLYFTRELFDLFYPGYGDTWPTFNGAVGMTYEQGGSGSAGLGIITAEGDTLTLGDRIAHHHTTGLATVEATAQNSRAVVEAFDRYFQEARTAPPGDYKTYLVKGGEAADKVAALAEQLEGQGIAYGYATRSRQATGFRYADGQRAAAAVAPGDLIVSAYQPKAVLAKVLFEPRSALSDSITYDITAWALPYVYGLDAYALPERLDADADAPQREAVAGSALTRPYAYLAEWKSFQDLQFLATVLREDVKLRFALKPFEAGGRRYAPGTLILTRANNDALGDRFDEVVREAAAALGQPLYPVASGFVTTGADFGSSAVRFLKRPRVAVLSGDPVSSYALGEVWHFFDRQIHYPATLIDAGDVGSVDLREYDVLVLPDGDYEAVFSEARLEELKDWIRGGGRLVALEGAVAFLAGKDGFGLARAAGEEKKDEEDAAPPQEAPAAVRSYGERERASISEGVPGSIFRVQVDNTHPLGFGYGDVYYALKLDDEAYAYLEDGWNVGVLGKEPLVSGFAGYKARRKLQNVLAFGVQEMGRGRVVYLVDDPLFRGFWYNGRLLFGNAVFLVGQE